MNETEQYFYKYTVVYYVENDEKSTLKTVSGITFGKTFNEVCDKLTDYFGEDVIEEMKIEFASDCDVLEEEEIYELFNTESKNKTNLANEIETGLKEAIEYEKGNLELRSTTLSIDKKE